MVALRHTGTKLFDEVEGVMEDPTAEDGALAVLEHGLGEMAVIGATAGRVPAWNPQDESEIPETEADLYAHEDLLIAFLGVVLVRGRPGSLIASSLYGT